MIGETCFIGSRVLCQPREQVKRSHSIEGRKFAMLLLELQQKVGFQASASGERISGNEAHAKGAVGSQKPRVHSAISTLSRSWVEILFHSTTKTFAISCLADVRNVGGPSASLLRRRKKYHVNTGRLWKRTHDFGFSCTRELQPRADTAFVQRR
jgi:hypothetical protein